MIRNDVREWILKVRQALSEVESAGLEEMVNTLVGAYAAGRTVYIMGNGGSAALAAHLTCDLKYAQRTMCGFRVVGLSDNVPLLTALANDLGYENVFRSQLEPVLRPGDVVIILSVSGDSENIVRAAELARQRGAATLGFLGSAGGRSRAQVDQAVVLSSAEFPLAESVHCVLTQLVAASFHRRIQELNGKTEGPRPGPLP